MNMTVVFLIWQGPLGNYLREMPLKLAKRPAPYRSLLGPSGPESVPEKRGCARECPTGCPPGPLGHGLRSVQKVSRECPHSVQKVSRHSRDTFLDTPEPEEGRAPRTPRGTLPWTPPFSGTLSGTLPGTLWARRAQETPVGGRALRNLKPHERPWKNFKNRLLGSLRFGAYGVGAFKVLSLN